MSICLKRLFSEAAELHIFFKSNVKAGSTSLGRVGDIVFSVRLTHYWPDHLKRFIYLDWFHLSSIYLLSNLASLEGLLNRRVGIDKTSTDDITCHRLGWRPALIGARNRNINFLCG